MLAVPEGGPAEYNQSLRRGGLFHYARRPTFTYYIRDHDVESDIFLTYKFQVKEEEEDVGVVNAGVRVPLLVLIEVLLPILIFSVSLLGT